MISISDAQLKAQALFRGIDQEKYRSKGRYFGMYECEEFLHKIFEIQFFLKFSSLYL